MHRLLTIIALALLVAACGQSQETPPPAAQRIADHFTVSLEVLTNFQGVDKALRADCKRAGGSGAICSTYRISLTNGGMAIAASERDWTLYFHSIRRTFSLLNRDDFKVEHVKGDLHRLKPNAHFAGIAAGETLELDFLAENWMQFESDFMPRLFVVGADGEALVIASTDRDSIEGLVKPIGKNDPDNWKRTAADANVLADAASRYADFTAEASAQVDSWRERIIPRPLKTKVVGEPVEIGSGIALMPGSLDDQSLAVIEGRLETLGLAGGGNEAAYPVKVSIDPAAFADSVSGAYQLETQSEGARIVGYDQAGAFYGLQSLLALADVRQQTLARVVVEDAPRFEHRGMFLDVGRNFHTKAVVLRMLEQMAAYKLNRFHFHLSDDEGWRLEIPGLPELTEVGGRRCFDLNEDQCLLPQLGSGPSTDNNGSGYFSVDDYVEILRYAAARHIEVVPEFDMPAHARAAVVAMEARYRRLAESAPEQASEYRLIDPEDDTEYLSVQFYNDSYINPCIDSTYRFVNKLIREVQAMHAVAGVPLETWHFGGDEAVNILASGSFENAPGSDPEKGDVPASARKQPWSDSPQCQKLVAEGSVESMDKLGEHYAKRVSVLLADAGIATMAAWNDGVKRIDEAAAELATSDNYANSWGPLFWGGGDESVHLAESGFDVVQSHSDFLYFDMPYEVDPKESGYYWASRYIDTEKTFSYAPLNTAQLAEVSTDRDGNGWSASSAPAEFVEHVRGIQGQLWSEVVRTDARVEYMVYPRLLALAERAWHRASWELSPQEGQTFSAETDLVDKAALARDWAEFAATLGHKELLKLDRAGVGYRVPVPGAVRLNGELQTAVPFPGLPVEVFDDERWLPVENAAANANILSVRARSADGHRAGRAVDLPAAAETASR
ncbi:beta-hexosaminidase [Microbulbifer flavimaris]|uniref:beta-N-acetylhexosaminidase n=1 Tax=Microbulbifer flavimaris TaxID=1781068 RepID=A0ABX4HWR7_9GAMM|nr:MULTISPECIES: family 20 glycosylhydrolase [Microbulbifer]KUJ81535.1 beta-hexosaminidase [Microbulbifer sp. ZGT114]PCO04438.1 beta-hexosaminidase [Microbulbifer flavimaris]